MTETQIQIIQEVAGTLENQFYTLIDKPTKFILPFKEMDPEAFTDKMLDIGGLWLKVKENPSLVINLNPDYKFMFWLCMSLLLPDKYDPEQVINLFKLMKTHE